MVYVEVIYILSPNIKMNSNMSNASNQTPAHLSLHLCHNKEQTNFLENVFVVFFSGRSGDIPLSSLCVQCSSQLDTLNPPILSLA